jgi:hypothetical protein
MSFGSLSLSREILVLGPDLLSSGTRFQRCGRSSLGRHSLEVSPLLYFVQERNISGMPIILFLRPGVTMGTGPSKIPSDTHLGCLLAKLESLQFLPDLKAKKTFFFFFCNQAWPQYQLDNNSKWPLDGTLYPNILRDLYTFCECTEK